ncbi:MAG: hypothetical protein ACKPCM_05585, partial [Pseudanabaena sp.]
GENTLQKITSICCPAVPQTLMEAVSRDGLCPQPATFWTQPKTEPSYQFIDRLIFCMDYEFWCHLLMSDYEVIKIDESIAFYRHHLNAKGTTMTDFMWAELAGLPLLKMPKFQHFDDKLQLASLSRKRLHHYLRLEIESIFSLEGPTRALSQLTKACFDDLSLLFERPTLGLIKKLIFTYF